jgi:hypothetical protein
MGLEVLVNTGWLSTFQVTVVWMPSYWNGVASTWMNVPAVVKWKMPDTLGYAKHRRLVYWNQRVLWSSAITYMTQTQKLMHVKSLCHVLPFGCWILSNTHNAHASQVYRKLSQARTKLDGLPFSKVAYLLNGPKSRTAAHYWQTVSDQLGCHWTIELIKKLFDIAWDLWEHRNNIKHHCNNQETLHNMEVDKICMMTTRLACNRAIESSYWRMDNNSDVGLLTGYVLYRLPIELEFMDLDTFSRWFGMHPSLHTSW